MPVHTNLAARLPALARDADPRAVAPALLDWYDKHARDLPWRALPGANQPDPYRVWLSEIMLQQTTVAAVTGYFQRFIERWPTVQALAAAEDAEVLTAWAGLGYYARARNLIAAARHVAGPLQSQFPTTEAGLRTLPGVGDYTAAAIAAIAFGERAVVVDANVIRVVARLIALTEPMPTARRSIVALTDSITPNTRAGDFAQAMMDLGSGVCTPRNPRCEVCPLAQLCCAKATGSPDAFPVRAPKRTKPHRAGTAWWIARDGHVWLVRRPERGMLGGMRALPGSDWAEAPRVDAEGFVPRVAHSFTHFDLTLAVEQIDAEAHVALHDPSGEWWPIAMLGEAGLPTLYVKAVDAVAKGAANRGGDA